MEGWYWLTANRGWISVDHNNEKEELIRKWLAKVYWHTWVQRCGDIENSWLQVSLTLSEGDWISLSLGRLPNTSKLNGWEMRRPRSCPFQEWGHNIRMWLKNLFRFLLHYGKIKFFFFFFNIIILFISLFSFSYRVKHSDIYVSCLLPHLHCSVTSHLVKHFL